MGELQPHIRLSDTLGIKYALLAGDPARVGRLAAHLENVEELAYHREYRSIRGTYKGISVLGLSTGIGGASMAIAVEELHKIGITAAIRVGSSGSLQAGIGLGDLILVHAAVREDGASRAYVPECFPAAASPELLHHCIQAAREGGFVSHVGLARSHDSFYTDQEQALCDLWGKCGVLAADMETGALYIVAALRGMRAASILNNVVLCAGDVATSIDQYVDGDGLCTAGERAELLTALEALVKLEGSHG